MPQITFNINQTEYDRLQTAIRNFSGHAGTVIDSVLHNEGGTLIHDEIMKLLPLSGRKWRGKATAAKRTEPFKQGNGAGFVTIYTKEKYDYLYFPDDGTNTVHHVGYKGQPRQFMMHGAENKTAQIIDLCVSRLINNLNSEGG